VYKKHFFPELDIESAVGLTPKVYSVQQFCEMYGIGRNLFYKMLAEGAGPKIMKLGRRTLISREAAEEWQRQIEENTSQSRSSRSHPFSGRTL